jgi:transcriptional regulator with XRE-family HTH domain
MRYSQTSMIDALGQELRRARQAAGRTLRQVETETGVSNAYLSQLETGKADNPSTSVLRKLAEYYGVGAELFLNAAGYASKHQDDSIRDVFLSHRSKDKDFVRELAAHVEAESHMGRPLRVWLDEAEIRPGDSIPAKVGEGLEKSRFIAAVMTPAYFESGSGWTDAEWHSILHIDPDNRRRNIIPLLVEDCPFIPYLLRHLKAIDFRGDRYQAGLTELLSVLKDEPLPRPVTHRGQLITPSGRPVDRSSMAADGVVPDADPDVVPETLSCNLLPVERLPRYIYTAGLAPDLIRTNSKGDEVIPSKSRLKQVIRGAQEQEGTEREHRFMPAFRLYEDRIITFHDLEDPESPLSPIIDENNVEVLDVPTFVRDEDLRKVLVSLLNMAIGRHLGRAGLVIDEDKRGRFFFPDREGQPHTITWTPRKKKATRLVAKPMTQDGKVLFWRNLGAYVGITFLANHFYIQISPTWVITSDGHTPATSPGMTRQVIKWTGPERNMQVLFHVRFWTSVLRRGKGGPISVRTGDQIMEVSTAPAFVHLSFGIASDQKELMGLLDEEAPLIAAEEDQRADVALDPSLAAELEEGYEDVLEDVEAEALNNDETE